MQICMKKGYKPVTGYPWSQKKSNEKYPTSESTKGKKEKQRGTQLLEGREDKYGIYSAKIIQDALNRLTFI